MKRPRKPERFSGGAFTIEIDPLTANLEIGPYRISYELAYKFHKWLTAYIAWAEAKAR